MRVKTKVGKLEELKRVINNLWKWSLELFWKACELLGKALHWFTHISIQQISDSNSLLML